jgi:hypothetical protein
MSNLTPRINRLDRNYLLNSAKDFTQRSNTALDRDWETSYKNFH